jgi:hypothetical protein
MKGFHDCNFLQSSEGNIDQAHLSFLHRIETSTVESAFVRSDASPVLDPVETTFGMRIYNVRKAGDGRQFVKVSNFVMPNFAAVPGGAAGDGYQVNWHVPIDDTHHWKYVLAFRRKTPPSPGYIQANLAEVTPDYHYIRNRANRYLQDREEMKNGWYAGLGDGFQAHDAFATEGGGPIQDRTQEHLGYTDRVILMSRRLLLDAVKAVQAGRDPKHVIRAPADNAPPDIVVRADVIPADVPWHEYWKATTDTREVAGMKA